jgi:predicted LPLAT superfamily acyltransferase
MEKKWDGKTKGSLWGYRFFIYCIRFLGVRISYFFCIWVSGYFVLFASKQRKGLIQFYQTGLGFSKGKSIRYAASNFYEFGKIIIDRVALRTSRKSFYSHSFDNEIVLREMHESGRGGFLFSGHVGNWENAGNLIGERITSKINVLMLDAEVEKIKQFVENSVEEAKYNLIPLKDDMSHLILIHQALKRNELIALHADRIQEGQKTFTFPFLNGKAKFPAGPFIMAHKFKVPITFVFAVKTTTSHFSLSATNPIVGGTDVDSPEAIAELYVRRLEALVQQAPKQWFNFYEYFENEK